ncbi:MAG TPA: hydantoinase/oxoprolinase family protein [Candidatus Binataceae bacterium]|nr:hydantoinase/oxoprolinase family protein [Candidatus Binataceae bacterium]
MKIVAGIDVGGTNTDAVLVRDGQIAAFAKVPTTTDVRSGIVEALAQLGDAASAQRVHIGTTSFTNALVERRELAPAAAVRLGGPVSQSLPPTCDWPEDLRAATRTRSFFIEGGREFDGRPIGTLDRAAIRDVARALAEDRITQAAVTGVFATSHPDDEIQAAKWLRKENPALAITMSHRIGRFGIIERENATLLNAMLRPLAARTIAAYHDAVSTRLFISQNDGTVVRSDSASTMPIFTVASGPTNSLRGASILGGARDAIVLDVGGTTTDAGVIHGGYPQPAGLELTVAGVRTNFRMPDLYSIGIGGGSLVDEASGAVGPRSVGFRLTSEALVFGGNTLTLTDVAVAAGRLAIGDPARVANLDRELMARVDNHLRRRLERLLENYERANQQLPVVLVGGGAALIEELLRSLGRTVICPAHAGIANALGAAMAQVGGEADLTFAAAEVSRAEALSRAEQEAHRRAVAAGAAPGSTITVELEDAALSYLAADAMRVRARAIGDIEESSQ